MSFQEIKIDNYKLWDFEQIRNDVLFKVAAVDRLGVDEADKEKIEAILNVVGKWESLIKTGLHLFSELRLIQLEQAALRNYEKTFGMEFYELGIDVGRFRDYFYVSFHLKPEERHKRERSHLDPLLPVEEIYDQIANISKWKAFEKTIKIIKEQWVNR